jgi:teichuronic acid biosynthesis glycosyltransferase TuaH
VGAAQAVDGKTEPAAGPDRDNTGVHDTTADPGEGRRLRVLWFAGVAWDAVRGTDQQLASAMSAHADVLYVDPPRPVHRGRLDRGWPPRESLMPGLERLRPRSLPGGYRPGIRRTTPVLLRAQARHAVRGYRPDVVLATSLDDVLTTVPVAKRVLVGTDDYVAGAALMGQPPERLAREERRQLTNADVVTAVTPTLAARWEAILGGPVEVVPNGCDVAHYASVDDATAPVDVRLPAPVIGLVGTLSERIDLALLEALARDGLGLLLVGPRRPSFEPVRFEQLVALPNVHWAGPQPYDALPGYLRLVDVGVTPYVDDDFNRASNPLKTLEYLAAGRPVVSTPLPAAVALGTDLVRLAQSPEQFVQAVRAAAVHAHDADLVRARRAFATRHSWTARAAHLLALVERPTRPSGSRTR